MHSPARYPGSDGEWPRPVISDDVEADTETDDPGAGESLLEPFAGFGEQAGVEQPGSDTQAILPADHPPSAGPEPEPAADLDPTDIHPQPSQTDDQRERMMPGLAADAEPKFEIDPSELGTGTDELQIEGPVLDFDPTELDTGPHELEIEGPVLDIDPSKLNIDASTAHIADPAGEVGDLSIDSDDLAALEQEPWSRIGADAPSSESAGSAVVESSAPSTELDATEDEVLELSSVGEPVYQPASEPAADEATEGAPWDALGKAVDDALLRAAESATVAPEGPISEAEAPAPEMGVEPDGEAEVIAGILETLAARLRHEGVGALDSAMLSDQRIESVLAAFLAGLRAANGD